MFLNILKYFFGSRNDRLLKKYNNLLVKVNLHNDQLKLLTDIELKKLYFSCYNNCKNENDLEKILPLVYAIVREVSYRVLGLRHYDVQILGGIALYYGKIAEIATGEGKTLIATLPVSLYSLLKKSIHIVTVNDYLAKRDAEWMNPIYNFLDISVGIIIPGMSMTEKKLAYQSNVVYGTSSEFGFDYLRDNIVLSTKEKVQRGLFYAIVDEVDSILIDESRTPLIISFPDKIDANRYILINNLVKNLSIYDSDTNDGDFILDEKNKNVLLTDKGFIHIESLFKKFNILKQSLSLYDPWNIELLHGVYSALKAHYFFKNNIDYLIKDGSILIIDENTGRIMDGRRWGDGIHQAIEAKEAVKIRSENQTVASITYQNYFRLYNRLSGMTGTAYTESVEFRTIYNLEVIVIPTNKKCIRIDKPDLIFLTQKAKFSAILKDIKICYSMARPVLVGTTSIEVSEYISKLLDKLKIKHNVLNAKYHLKEAHIISEAGKLNSVTIATNMAGRGTDIVLGGKFEIKHENKSNYEAVIKLGGLKIIGTERHEARRIDNQLRGRSGRQGDPGCSQFYLSLEDNLVRIFIGEKLKTLLNKLNISDDESISHPLINKSIENAQKRVEIHNFNIRKELLEFDDIVDEQRKVIYEYRNYLIFNENISNIIHDIFTDVIRLFLKNFQVLNGNFYATVDIVDSFILKFGLHVLCDAQISEYDFIFDLLLKTLDKDYKEKKESNLFLSEKILLLNVLDIKWREHLMNLEYMKKGIYLRAYAQKDPKQEYKKEAFLLFESMFNDIKFEFVLLFSKIKKDDYAHEQQTNTENLSFEHEKIDILNNNNDKLTHENKTYIRQKPKIGRNEPCFCKSGKKYKQCHGNLQ